jgi:hypothetical protein
MFFIAAIAAIFSQMLLGLPLQLPQIACCCCCCCAYFFLCAAATKSI